MEDENKYGLLHQAYKWVEFRRSFLRGKERCVYLAKNIEYSTAAHELFHEIDVFDESYSKLVVKRKYRGAADIINGMSGGKVKLGYRHADDYWKRERALQKETWAQYGRMYYSGDKEAMESLRDIFPETTKEFERIIKAVSR